MLEEHSYTKLIPGRLTTGQVKSRRINKREMRCLLIYYYSTDKNMPNYGIGHKNQSLDTQFQCIKFSKGKIILFGTLGSLQNQNQTLHTVPASKLPNFFDSCCLSLNKSITTLNFAGAKQLTGDNLHNVLLGNHSNAC